MICGETIIKMRYGLSPYPGPMTLEERVKKDMDLFGQTKEMAQERDLWRGFHSGKPDD